MGADSKIAWTDHTFNPWWGCVRVSPGCQHCYAETFAKRVGQKVWGVEAPRRFFGDKHWNEPFQWALGARRQFGRKARVFCASMADVCEDRRDLDEWRDKLWGTISLTANDLDWLLLTKRPENLRRLVPDDILRRCWVGTTAEDQPNFDARWPHLRDCPAAVRFLSCEPLLGPLDIREALPCRVCGGEGSVPVPGGGKACPACFRWAQGSPTSGPFVDWVIVGGESGPKARPFGLAWARALVEQCRTASVPVFVKQLGARPCIPEGAWRADVAAGAFPVLSRQSEDVALKAAGLVQLALRDRKGGDMAEWPEELRVREWPEVRS